MRYTLLLFLKIYLLIVLLMSVYVSPQSSYSRGRGIRASEVAREMLETPNMGRCIEDLLPRMHIIEDRNDANDILHRSQPMVAEYFCCLLLDIISARHL
jgi:hypothetical protein